MTVDELWEEAKSLLGRPSIPSDRLREVLSKLVATPQGRSRFVQGLEKGLKGMPKLLRHFARMMEPSEEPSSGLGHRERIELLEASVKAARGQWKTDATYWMFLWLLLKSGQTAASAKAASDLKFLNSGGRNPNELYVRVTTMEGWADFSRERWIELIDKARAAEPTADFQGFLQNLVELIRATGGKSTRPSATATTTVPVPAKGTTPVEATPPQGSGATATEDFGIPAEKSSTPAPPLVRPEPSVETQPSRQTTATVSTATPVDKSSTPAPPLVQPEPSVQAAGDTVTPLEKSSPPASAEVRTESSEGKQTRPRRAASTRKPGKQALPASPNETVVEADGGASNDPTATVNSRSGRTAILSSEFGGEVAAALADIASAVRSISDRIDQMVGRTSEQASQGEKLSILEKRVAELGRVLSEAPAEARRSREEVERLQSRIQEQEEELLDARRERDEAAARAEDMARRLASMTARIEAAERRADQNIHEAFRERDAAVLTFKARLWDAIQAQLADVSDPTHGERFANTEEEVLTTRLRTIRNLLRAEGIPP